MTNDKHQLNALWKRSEQLKRWIESETNKESSIPKARISKVNFQQPCVFLAACASGDKNEVSELLSHGVDINTANADGLTALHQACIDGNIDIVRYLISKNAGVNIQDNEGWTPLHNAASCGNLEITRFLVASGADLSLCTFDGELPVDIAENDEVASFLKETMTAKDIDGERARKLEHDIMLLHARNWLNNPSLARDRPHPKTGATALHVAAAKGYLDVVKLLLEAGADPNAQDIDGWTPLHAAAHWDQKEVIDALIESGADINRLNFSGQAPADLCDENMEAYLTSLQEKQKQVKLDRITDKVVSMPAQSYPSIIRPAKTVGADDSKLPIINTYNGNCPVLEIDASVPKKDESKQSIQSFTYKETDDTSLHSSNSENQLKTSTSEHTRKDRISHLQQSLRGLSERFKTNLEEDFVASRRSRFENVSKEEPTLSKDKVMPSRNVKRWGSGSSAGESPYRRTKTPLAAAPLAEITTVTVSSPPPYTVTANVSVSSNTPPAARSPSDELSHRRHSRIFTPGKDDEAEAERKKRSAKARRERRSTQGVTREDIKAAEHQIKSREGLPPTGSHVTPDVTETPVSRDIECKDIETDKLQKWIEQSKDTRRRPSETQETKEVEIRSSGDTDNIPEAKRSPERVSRHSPILNAADKKDDQSVTSETESYRSSQSAPAYAMRTKRESINTESPQWHMNNQSSEIEDYKLLFERASRINDEHHSTIAKLKRELYEKDHLIEKLKSSSYYDSSVERREKKEMMKRISELEEEVKKIESLKADNARLKEENAALIRVISKLSK